MIFTDDFMVTVNRILLRKNGRLNVQCDVTGASDMINWLNASKGNVNAVNATVLFFYTLSKSYSIRNREWISLKETIQLWNLTVDDFQNPTDYDVDQLIQLLQQLIDKAYTLFAIVPDRYSEQSHTTSMFWIALKRLFR